MSKVSIIVPVYNVEKYIDKCLYSLINQTLKDIEIICINDCGKDNSIKIVEEYAKKDDRIKIIYNNKNKGIASVRNIGLKNILSDYIMQCDPDDFYNLDMCEKMYNSIIDNDCDIAICATNIIYLTDRQMENSDNKYYKLKFKNLQNINENTFKKTDVSVWNKIYKKSIIDKYNITFPDGLLYEDACFFYKYLAIAKNIFYLDEKLYNYVRREGSIMNQTFSQKSTKSIDHIKIIENVFEFYKKNDLFNKYQNILFKLLFNYFCLSMKYSIDNKYVEIIDTTYTILKKLNINYNNCDSYEKKIFDLILTKKYQKIIDIYYNGEIIKKKNIKLFSFIPLLKITTKENETIIKLLNFIPLLIIKKSRKI